MLIQSIPFRRKPPIVGYDAACLTARVESRTAGLRLVLATPGGYRIAGNYREIGEDCLCAVYSSGVCLENIFASEARLAEVQAAYDAHSVGDRWDGLD